jgi:DNA-binding transcriptional LysR family regulator
LSAGEQIGLEVLPPILADFALRHPRIAIELSLSNRNEDLLKRAADLAVRMARPTQKLLVCRRIGSVKVGLFAHRRYIEMRGAPRTPADLPHHCLIGFDRDMSVLRSMGRSAAALKREDFHIRTDCVAAQIALMRAGAGITAAQVNVARRNPDLVPVLAQHFMFDREIWLVTHPDLRASPRVRLLFDQLALGLARYARE